MINDTTMVRNKYYHTEGDTIETLNFDKMTEVLNGCYHAVINMQGRVFAQPYLPAMNDREP